MAPLSGFGIGAIVGMTGVGGGSLMTPLLLTVFKLNPAVAVGTDLWFAAITKTAGSVSHNQAGHVDWRVTRRLLAGSIPPERAGVYMGIFNMFIVIPMLIQAVTLPLFYDSLLGGRPENVIRLAGVLLALAAVCVLRVRTEKST